METRFDDSDDLLREHVDGVRRIARHLVRDPDEADDVAQESLLAALSYPPRGVRNLGAWLRGIVRHKALQRTRTDSRRRRHEGEVAPLSGESGAGDVVARLEVQEQLVAALKALPAPYRNVLWRRYFEGVSAREIASDLDMPVETVRTRIKRGLARLRADMDQRHGGRHAIWTAALLPVLPKGGLSAALALKGALGIMTTKTALTSTVALVALLIAALVVVTFEGPPRSPLPAQEGHLTIAGHDESVAAPPPSLVGHAATPTDRAPVSGTVATPERPHLVGRVLDTDHEPVRGALVTVVEGPGLSADEDTPWRILGEARVDERGLYDVPLDLPNVASATAPRTVLAIAEAEDRVCDRHQIAVEGNRTRLDFSLDAGLAFEGYVRDLDDRPVADLPVRVATLSSPPHMMYGSLYWSESRRLATESESRPYLEAKARTNEDGYFRVQGLGAGRYGLISEDLRWFIEQEELVDVDVAHDSAPVMFLAVRARAVMGSVRDATTGEELQRALVEFMLTAPCGDSMGSSAGVRGGRFLAGWNLDDELSGRVDVIATASADGYKEARMTGVLLPEEPILRLNIALEPITERDGTVLLTATEPRGAPLLGLVGVYARRQGDDGVRLRRRPVAEGRGVFRFDLPEGTYDVEVVPFHVLGDHASGQCVVTVIADQEVAATVVAGGGATVRLCLPKVTELPTGVLLGIEAVGERTHRQAGACTDLTLEAEQILRGEELVWAGFLPGTWRFELQWGGERLQRTVELEEGDDQVVDFR